MAVINVPTTLFRITEDAEKDAWRHPPRFIFQIHIYSDSVYSGLGDLSLHELAHI